MFLVAEIVAAVAAIGVFGTLAFLDWREDRHRTAAVDTARETVHALMSISPTTIDEHFALVEETSTGEFAEQFAKTSDTIRETVMSYATKQSAEVLKAAYASGDSDSAIVLLAVDATTVHQSPATEEDAEEGEESEDAEAEADAENPAEPIVSHYRIKAEMALVDGEWKLSGLEMSA